MLPALPGLGNVLNTAARVAPAPTDVWFLHTHDLPAAWLDDRLLDGDERRRAAHLERAADRAEFIAAHLLLREVLGRRLDVAPEELSFTRSPCPRCGGPHGRPVLDTPDPPVQFSLSRSNGLVLVAVAEEPVGVDVEALPDRATALSVSELLHPVERAKVLAAPPAQQPAVFASLWTRKEAQLKGVGVGVAVDMAAEDPRAAVADGWRISDLEVGVDHAAAVAVRRPGAAGAESPKNGTGQSEA